MNDFALHVLQKAKKEGLISFLSEDIKLFFPVINKVELYLSFHGNDRCIHCITCSGPDRDEVMPPDITSIVLRNISKYSILKVLKNIFKEGEYQFKIPLICNEFDSFSSPPKKITDSLIEQYASCIMGKNFTSNWINKSGFYKLNFGRPSIRISGGEFYTWPHKLNGKILSEDERLYYQKKLIKEIRLYLPEYDIWILTNGRFAENRKKTEKVIKKWSGENEISTNNEGKIRICISVDVFHKHPKGSTVEKMLEYIWASTKKNGLGAPYIYSVTNRKIFLLGRALENFDYGIIRKNDIKNYSLSKLNDINCLYTDPVKLAETDGCNELKGFCCNTPYGSVLANNIVVTPSGHLAYCCVCVGDYGDFVNDPEKTLGKIIKDPIANILRKKRSAVDFLNIATNLDPTIKVFGNTEYEKATGSTCYQVLSGKRFFSKI